MSVGPMNGWKYTDADEALQSVALTIRQCWAFHLDGTRCDMPAGHPGDHCVERTWTDDECLDPTQNIPRPTPAPAPATLVTGNSPAPVVVVNSQTGEIVPPIPKCVACQHAHAGGACKCGCYEFIG